MVHKTSITLALAALLTTVGCAGPQNRRADPNAESRIDARGVQDDDFIIAARDLSRKISERTARGWPSHVLLTEEGIPVVTVHKIVNRSRMRTNNLNLSDVYNNIYNELVNQGAVYVDSREQADMEAVAAERGFSETETTEAIPEGQADRASMVINGEITQETIRGEDGVDEYTTFFSLRLVDTVKGRMVLVVRTKVRKEFER